MNRIAGVDDIALYGNYIKEGDFIIDTPNKQFDDGTNGVIYYFINTQIPELRGTPTFWFDGDKLGFVNILQFQHTAQLEPWIVSKAIFKPIPGTQIVAGGFRCKGLHSFELNGEDLVYHPGLRQWPKDRKFLTGAFGFHIIAPLTGGHGYDVSVQDGGEMVFKGFESQHGFSGLRLQQDNDGKVITRLVIENFYIHDTCTGEPMYVGSTKASPIPRFENVEINNGIISRAAAESVQLQNMAGSNIRNLTIYAGQTNWLNAFQNYQSTCFQFLANGGINRIHNILVDGYGNGGFMPFSAQSPDYQPQEVNEVIVENVLFHNGRSTGTYFNKSCSSGVHWRFKNLMYTGFNGSWYNNTGNVGVSQLFRTGGGTDKISIERLIHDGSKFELFDDPSKYIIGELVQIARIDTPKYRNSGFYEDSHRIMQWKSVYASYFPCDDNTPTEWKTGDIAIDIDEIHNTYKFYKCLADHTATVMRPGENIDMFKHLTWDSNGVRNDQNGWFGELEQFLLPPDDLRLIQGHSLSHLGIEVPPTSEVNTSPARRYGIVEDYFLQGQRYTVIDNGDLYINNVKQTNV